MTLETKYLIDFEDILGLEFECHACKGKFVLGQPHAELMNCPLCNEEWLRPHTQEWKGMHELLISLGNATKNLQGRPFALRLQIGIPPTQQAAATRN